MSTFRTRRAITKPGTNVGSYAPQRHSEPDPAIGEHLAWERTGIELGEGDRSFVYLDHSNFVGYTLTPDPQKLSVDLGDKPTQRLTGTKFFVARMRRRSEDESTEIKFGGSAAVGFANFVSYRLRTWRPNSERYEIGRPVNADPIELSRAGFMTQLGNRISRAYADDTWGVTGRKPAVVVTTIACLDGQRRHIVTVPGTKFVGRGPTGLASDFHTFAGAAEDPWNDYAREDPGALTLMTFEAMDQAGIRSDEEVMLVGHSLGGMVAADLASRPQTFEKFTIASVVTFGSPIGTYPIRGDVSSILAFEHGSDPITKADLRMNRNREHHGYRLHATQPIYGQRTWKQRLNPFGAHSMNRYTESADSFARGRTGQNWMDENERFMTGLTTEMAFPMERPREDRAQFDPSSV